MDNQNLIQFSFFYIFYCSASGCGKESYPLIYLIAICLSEKIAMAINKNNIHNQKHLTLTVVDRIVTRTISSTSSPLHMGRIASPTFDGTHFVSS